MEHNLGPAVEALLVCSVEIAKVVVQCGAVSVLAPPPAAAVICALEGAAAGKCVAEAYFANPRVKG